MTKIVGVPLGYQVNGATATRSRSVLETVPHTIPCICGSIRPVACKAHVENGYLQRTDLRAAGHLPRPPGAGQSEVTSHGVRRLIEAGAVDIVNFDASEGGGVSDWRRAAALCATAGLKVAHHEESQIAQHLISAISHGTCVECFADPERDPVWQQMWVNRPPMKDGMMMVSTGGLRSRTRRCHDPQVPRRLILKRAGSMKLAIRRLTPDRVSTTETVARHVGSHMTHCGCAAAIYAVEDDVAGRKQPPQLAQPAAEGGSTWGVAGSLTAPLKHNLQGAGWLLATPEVCGTAAISSGFRGTSTVLELRGHFHTTKTLFGPRYRDAASARGHGQDHLTVWSRHCRWGHE